MTEQTRPDAASGPGHLPRLLTIMGSGETAPTMVKVHRMVVDRLRTATAREPRSGVASKEGDADGILLDTPFGFQTNAEEIGARAVAYFAESVGARFEVAGVRSSSDVRGERGDRIVSRLVELPLIFSGPGSPSYALRQWRDTLVPSVIAEKLRLGGAVTFASAAALTLGSATVPVYEIYKVGEDPHWLEGLDLLNPLGLPAVVIPHYDNTEGQTHDTRYCYLGEERLAQMERDLDDASFVLGVDEHTAIIVDLGARSVEVTGHGAMTIRRRGRSVRVENGRSVTFDELMELSDSLLRASVVGASAPARSAPASSRAPSANPEANARAPANGAHGPGPVSSGAAGSPLLHGIRRHEEAFRTARERSDAAAMASAALALEEEMWAWRADTLQSDEMERGRASLRAMVSELGSLAESGTKDPAELLGPYVELAMSLRETARHEGRFEIADEIRNRLESLGVTISDDREGSVWTIGKAGPVGS